MKKLFTLLTLLLCVASSAWAGDVYKFQLNGDNKEFINGTESGTPTFFKWNTAKHNFNTKFNGCTYDGVSYTKGLKMEGATEVSWTSTATSTVIIVQSTWSSNTIKFDNTELAIADAEAITGGRVYTISGVDAGNHSVTRGSGESGVFAITVEYTGTVKPQLATPEITAKNDGEVTIGSVANASKITYTTDGTDPTSESTEYKASFSVTDGTTVKAIAIGDDVNYTNSDVASKVVLISGITVATPVIKHYNGSVGITCATYGASIKYSIDGGTTYADYARTFTLSSDATVKAYAVRANCVDSEEASADVTVLNIQKSKTIYLSYSNFTQSNNNTAIGNANTDAEGYTIAITGNTSKELQSANSITVGGESLLTFKVSNGAQNTLTIPDGVHVTGITFYSYNNYADDYVNGWKEVAGTWYEDQNADSYYGNIPLQGNATDFTDWNTNPDSRSYAVDQTGGTITFTNGGNQLCYVIALDIYEGIPEPVDPVAAAAITEVATINSDGTSSSVVTPNTYADVITTSGSAKSTEFAGYSCGLKLESNSGQITISLPQGASNASVTLLSSASFTALKINGTSQNVTVTGDDTNGYTTTLDISDDLAGTNYTIAKGSGSPVIYLITLSYMVASENEMTLTTTSTMQGWRAFYDASSGYTLDANTKAYVATKVEAQGESDVVVLDELGDAVPAGMAVLLKTTNQVTTSTDGHYSMTLTKASNVPMPDIINQLKRAADAINNKVYRLGANDAGVGFFEYTKEAAKPDVVVLDVDASSAGARGLTIAFADDEATAIHNVNDNVNLNKVVFDLQGRRVLQPGKGLYIVNGKKVVIK